MVIARLSSLSASRVSRLEDTSRLCYLCISCYHDLCSLNRTARVHFYYSNMPGRSRVSAPANRIYCSPAPEYQTTFKPPKQHINTRPSLKARKPSQQQTLTQIDFVNSGQLAKDFTVDDDTYEEDRRPRKRCRTVKDDTEKVSRYYTQTLTQLDFTSSTPFDSDDSEDTNNLEELYQSDLAKRPSTVTVEVPKTQDGQGIQIKREITDWNGLPRTPSKTSLGKNEIPSSQSPATPFSICSRGSIQGTPLLERSIDVQTTQQIFPSRGPARGIKLEIEDSFEDFQCKDLSTYKPSLEAKVSDPRKAVRFVESSKPRPRAVDSDDSLSLRPETTSRDSPSGRILDIIEDTEAESEEEPETCYSALGADTQYHALKLITSLEGPLEVSRPACLDASKLETSQLSSELSWKDCHEGSQSGDLDVEADLSNERLSHNQESQSQRLSTQVIDAMGPRSDRSDIFISIHPQHVTNIVSRTKNHEFRSYALPSQVKRIWIYTTRPVSAVKYMAIIGPAKIRGQVEYETGLGNTDFNAGKGTNRYAYEILELYELANPLSLHQLKDRNWLEGPPQKYAYVRPAVLDHLLANLSRALFSTESHAPPATAQNLTDSQEAAEQLQSTIWQFSDPQHHIPTAPSSPGSYALSDSNHVLDLGSTQQNPDVYAETTSHPTPQSQQRIPLSQATTVDLTQPSTTDASIRVADSPLVQQAPVHGCSVHASSISQHDGNSYEDQGAKESENDQNISNNTAPPSSPTLASGPSLPSSIPSSLVASAAQWCLPLPPLPSTTSSSRIDDMPIPFSLASSQLLTEATLPDSMPPLPPVFIEDSDSDPELV